jgi:5'-deoxynucleotidase YfbR-like HD superfamily hydrolase
MQLETLISNANGPDRLAHQLTFVAEIDKLKDVLRRNFVGGSRRNENSAEHSWHLAVMALVLLEDCAEPGLDRLHILKLVLLHDIVEIDAGDTFGYDAAGHVTKAAREKKAADRIFNLLPSDQALQFRQLWDEFEAGRTKEARLAQGLDRAQAVLQSLHTGGIGWRQHKVTKAQILEYNQPIATALPAVWEVLRQQIDQIHKS